MVIDLHKNYKALNTFLAWFHPESPLHYHKRASDEEVIYDFCKPPYEPIISALQDAKRLLELPEFPSDRISSVINRRFDNYEEDVKPWFLSVLKLLEEEAEKQGIEIPEDLKGLWRQG